MQKSSAVVAAGLMCLMVLTAAAQEKGGSQTRSAPVQQPAGVTQAQKAVKKTKLFGTVRLVGAANRKIVVRTATGKTRKITLSAGTRLDKGSNHKEITLADLKLGDPIDIIMEGKVVRAIHLFLVPK